MAQVVIALTAANNNGVWYVPVDCTGSITIELIGPGNGGGGGAYAKSNISVTPGSKYYTNFVNDTWINTTNTAPTAGSSNTTGVKAAGGTFSTGAGGTVANSAYNVLAYAGGSGGPNFNGYDQGTSQGAGGAAGPSGPGGNGEIGVNYLYGGRGGSSNGRAAGYNGGAGYEGSFGNLGTKDPIYTDFIGNTYGPAGGASLGQYYSSSKSSNSYASNYSYAAASGGGGITAIANNGLIIITYTPTQIAGTYTEFITTPGTTPWRVPLGVTSIKAESIGRGGPGHTYGVTGYGGGGGGAYAATNSIPVIQDAIAYAFIPYSTNDYFYYTASPTWFNSTYNLPPTSTSLGVKADSGLAGGNGAYGLGYLTGGLASNSIGDTKLNGGSGVANFSSAYRRGAGGGGAAGPGGVGKNGGRDLATGTSSGGGGGGGGAGGASSSTGTNAVTTTGGTGGNGPSGTTGGLGGNTTRVAAAGTNGAGGGGGGGTNTSTYRYGGDGSTYPQWTSTAGDTAGPGSGGGGAGGTSTSGLTTAGNGGTYGGGGGAGASISGNTNLSSYGGQGLIVLTYTVPAVSASNDRYWVGGTGTWDGSNTANWSTSSGGLSGASVPTTANNVFFDANSNTGTGAFTVTIATTTAICVNFDATGIDGAMTLAGSANLQVFGNFALPATLFTNSFTGTLIFAARTTGKTINVNGKSFNNVSFDGVGSSWTLYSNFTVTAAVTLNGGTLNLGGYVLSAFNFSSSNSNTRSIEFNSGSISLTGNANTADITLWDMATASGFTYTGTPTVNVPNTSTNSGFTRTFNHGNTTGASEANTINLNIQAGNTGSIVSVSGSFLNLNFTGCSSTLTNTVKNIYGNLTLSSSMTITAGANAITFASTNATTRTITSNGTSLNCPITFNGVGGAWQLQDALNTNGYAISLLSGSFDSNSKNITCDYFSYQSFSIKILTLGTSTVTITGGASGYGFVGFSNNTTYSISNSTIVFTTSGQTCYSNGSGIVQNGAGTVTMAGTGQLYLGAAVAEGSCGTLNNTANQTCTFALFCSTAFTVANFAVTGSETNSVIINSVSSQYKTLKQTSGTVNTSYYLVIQNTIVTGGATWNVYNSIDAGNNTGWNFLGSITFVFTSSSTFTVPAGITSITAEAIGGGGSFQATGSGGGGAYAKSNVIAVTPGSTVYVGVGPAGADSWANTANSKPVFGTTPVSQAVLAKAGTSTTGGQSSASIGTVKFSGGNSGAVPVASSQRSSNPGSGGAAGPNGPGGNGGDGIASAPNDTYQTYGGGGGGGAGAGGSGTGGGANGATATTANQNGANGGNNAAGSGAGAGGIGSTASGSAGINGGGGGGGGGDDTVSSGSGANGSIGVIRAWGIYGPGSGAGGNGGGVDGVDGTGYYVYYGGGGSIGSSGLVVISYSNSNGNALSLFL